MSRRRGKCEAAFPTRAATSGSASPTQATATETSSSDSTSERRNSGASASSSATHPSTVPCHRPDVVEARRKREATVRRHEVVGRLETDRAATRGRDPDRSAGVRAERRVREARRERRRRAAARAAGYTAGRERVRNRPVVRVLRGRSVRELVQVRLADVGVACAFRSTHGLGRLRRHVLGEHRRPVGRDEPFGVEQVLDGERDALVRALGPREEDPVGLSRNGGTRARRARRRRP